MFEMVNYLFNKKVKTQSLVLGGNTIGRKKYGVLPHRDWIVLETESDYAKFIETQKVNQNLF
jgi:hypothetical protein